MNFGVCLFAALLAGIKIRKNEVLRNSSRIIIELNGEGIINSPSTIWRADVLNGLSTDSYQTTGTSEFIPVFLSQRENQLPEREIIRNSKTKAYFSAEKPNPDPKSSFQWNLQQNRSPHYLVER
jgi:hypothetical protein